VAQLNFKAIVDGLGGVLFQYPFRCVWQKASGEGATAGLDCVLLTLPQRPECSATSVTLTSLTAFTAYHMFLTLAVLARRMCSWCNYVYT
jgi:hypothetical protein